MKFKHCLTIIGLGVFAALLVGCPSTGSGSIATDALYFDIDVEQLNGQAVATVFIKVGGPLGTSVQLTDGDRLSVNGQSMTVNTFPVTRYRATITEADAYDFEFSRMAEGPFVSTVSAPMASTIIAPAEDAQISRASSFDIVWQDNSQGDAESFILNITGECIDNLFEAGLLDTQYTVQAGDLEEELDEGGSPDAECEATIEVSANAPGTMAEGLQGTIAARATAETTIQTVP